jgi:hypothetical protein
MCSICCFYILCALDIIEIFPHPLIFFSLIIDSNSLSVTVHKETHHSLLMAAGGFRAIAIIKCVQPVFFWWTWQSVPPPPPTFLLQQCWHFTQAVYFPRINTKSWNCLVKKGDRKFDSSFEFPPFFLLGEAVYNPVLSTPPCISPSPLMGRRF